MDQSVIAAGLKVVGVSMVRLVSVTIRFDQESSVEVVSLSHDEGGALVRTSVTKTIRRGR